MLREKEAHEAAKKMEEASLKATIARNNMVAVRIFFFYNFNFYFRQVKKEDLLHRIVLLIGKNAGLWEIVMQWLIWMLCFKTVIFSLRKSAM